MGLRASRPAPAGNAPAPAAQDVTPQAAPSTPAPAPSTPVGTAPAQHAAPVGTAPALAQAAPLAVATPGSLQDVNAGILENIDNLGSTGNYVSVDGSEFLYKGTNVTKQTIDIVVSYGKRFYQWVDETNPQAKVFNNSDTKLNDNYKLKFEIRWLEEGEEEGDEAVEYTMSLSTTSAMQFIDYVKKLATAGLGVGQVWTRMTISRHENKQKDRYSRVEFEAFRLDDGQPTGVKTQ